MYGRRTPRESYAIKYVCKYVKIDYDDVVVVVRKFCLPVKTSCPPAGNIHETTVPSLCLFIEQIYI